MAYGCAAKSAQQKEMHKITWLHISDLHLNKQEVETRRLRNALPDYLKKLGVTCNYVFCTGDLRYAPSKVFDPQTKDRLHALCDAVCTPIERLFIVPGNHDVNRDAEGRAEAIASIHHAGTHTGSYTPTVGQIPLDQMAVIQKGQNEFKQILEEIYAEVPDRATYYGDPTAPHFIIETEDLNVLHVDSTITYTAEQERELIMGTGFLMDTLEKRNSNKPTVLLTHYSYDFLDRNEQREIVELLKDHQVQLWIAGHEHDHLIRKQADLFYELQCGNLVLENGAKACVILGEYDIDTAQGHVQVHAWFPQGGWAIYPFVSHQDDPSRYHFQTISPFVGARDERAPILIHAQASLSALCSEGGMFHRLSLKPTLLPDLEYAGQCFQNQEGTMPILQLLDHLWQEKGRDPANSCHALLLGDGGMGKSTAMFVACQTLLSENRLAIFVSLQSLEGMGCGIKAYLQRSLYQDVSPTTWNLLCGMLIRRQETPSLTILVDGFNEISGETARGYISEIKELIAHPGVQLMVSSRLDFLRDYGMHQLLMVHTADLREEQIRPLFDNAMWHEIEGNRELRILLRNPMLTLLYAETCPVVEKNREISYCDWRLPIMNAADLLHDYYLAQVVLQLERNRIDGHKVLNCMLAIRCVLPLMGELAERNNWLQWKEEAYEALLPTIQLQLQKQTEQMPLQLKRIKRSFGLTQIRIPDGDELYALLVSELCLIRCRNGEMAFPHQVFRDYCAAVYMDRQLDELPTCSDPWKYNAISLSVAGYLKYMRRDVWAENGLCHQMLAPYRGQEASEGDHLIENVLACWMSQDAEKPVTRDLSHLDLRKISLAEHLKRKYAGVICLEGAKVSKQTFVVEQRHNQIIGLAFSHDGKTLAAISQNGYVSVTNVITRSQMIVGDLTLQTPTKIGFGSEDELIVTSGEEKYAWRTVSYEKLERADEQVQILQPPVQMTPKIRKLLEILKDDELLGECHQISENGQLVAIGHKNGLLRIWDAEKECCIADLSLGDSQITTASFTKDGRIAAFCSGGHIVQIWDVHGQACLKTLHLPRRVRQVRFLDRSDILECVLADGGYYVLNLTHGQLKEYPRTQRNAKTKQALRRKLSDQNIKRIEMAANGNAIIMAEKSTEAWTWDQKLKRMNLCEGHRSPVKAIAICHADPRFAASYSDERIPREKGMRSELIDQKVVRVRIIKTGQCQWRLPTKNRTITALQFFTTNRIMLAAFSTNGDIMLWELINERKWGKEIGHWRPINVVRGHEAEPLECAVSETDDIFISAYNNGTVQIRPFGGGAERHFRLFPGVDFSAIQYREIDAPQDIKTILKGYPH